MSDSSKLGRARNFLAFLAGKAELGFVMVSRNDLYRELRAIASEEDLNRSSVLGGTGPTAGRGWCPGCADKSGNLTTPFHTCV